MRNVTVPFEAVEAALSPDHPGEYIVVPVMVDWPELRLTEEQTLANALALAYDEEPPFPRRDVFEVRLERY